MRPVGEITVALRVVAVWAAVSAVAVMHGLACMAGSAHLAGAAHGTGLASMVAHVSGGPGHVLAAASTAAVASTTGSGLPAPHAGVCVAVLIGLALLSWLAAALTGTRRLAIPTGRLLWRLQPRPPNNLLCPCVVDLGVLRN